MINKILFLAGLWILLIVFFSVVFAILETYANPNIKKMKGVRAIRFMIIMLSSGVTLLVGSYIL